jgi:hypothetical protein
MSKLEIKKGSRFVSFLKEELFVSLRAFPNLLKFGGTLFARIVRGNPNLSLPAIVVFLGYYSMLFGVGAGIFGKGTAEEIVYKVIIAAVVISCLFTLKRFLHAVVFVISIFAINSFTPKGHSNLEVPLILLSFALISAFYLYTQFKNSHGKISVKVDPYLEFAFNNAVIPRLDGSYLVFYTEALKYDGDYPLPILNGEVDDSGTVDILAVSHQHKSVILINVVQSEDLVGMEPIDKLRDIRPVFNQSYPEYNISLAVVTNNRFTEEAFAEHSDDLNLIAEAA